MFRELVEVSQRFQKEGKLPPSGYKLKTPKWIISLEKESPFLKGPYKREDIQAFFAPDRQRSGKCPPPFLLFDKAKYVLGISDSGEKNTDLSFHQNYIELLDHAYQTTLAGELKEIIDFLKGPSLEEIQKNPNIKPEDLIAFQIQGRNFIEQDSLYRILGRDSKAS